MLAIGLMAGVVAALVLFGIVGGIGALGAVACLCGHGRRH